MKIVLILNDIHGFPSALRQNALRSHTWATQVYENCLLTDTESMKSFEDSVKVTETENVFHAVQKVGGETVLLGSHPPHWRETSATVISNSYELSDPRCEMYSQGVNRCSLYSPPTERNGSASTYDDDVCEQTCEILQSFSGSFLLLWVNFSCFDDLERIQFTSSAERVTKSMCVPPQPSTYDRRTLPLCVSTYLDGISESSRRTEQQYVSLLEASKSLFDRHCQRIERIVESALSRDGTCIAYTSTHSLSIGEHAVRGGHAPLGTCCETFWLSNTPSTLPVHSCLRDLIASLVSDACGRAIHPVEPFSHRTVCRDGFQRCIVRIADHQYSCIVRQERILFVFDLSSDPEESHDVYPSLGHLHAEFERLVPRDTVTQDVPPVPPPRTAPVRITKALTDFVAPPLPPPPVQTPVGGDDTEEHSVVVPSAVNIRIPSPSETSSIISRQPSFSRRVTTSSSTTSTSSSARNNRPGVRQTEARLNKLHR